MGKGVTLLHTTHSGSGAGLRGRREPWSSAKAELMGRNHSSSGPNDANSAVDHRGISPTRQCFVSLWFNSTHLREAGASRKRNAVSWMDRRLMMNSLALGSVLWVKTKGGKT